MGTPNYALGSLKRTSLAAQAAVAIREGIHRSLWTRFLPSERRLSQMLEVSRPTIRTALHQLAEEGVVTINECRLSQIVSNGQMLETAQLRLVVIITREPQFSIPSTTQRWISEIRMRLVEQGFTTEVFICRPDRAFKQRQKIEAFLRKLQVFCCVLCSISPEIQRWFSRRSIPTLMLGSPDPSVRLPSVDVDYRAVCRHAGGIFLSQGHRRIALLVPDSKLLGDLASEEGFLEAFSQSNRSEKGGAVIIHHDGTAIGICAKLDLLFSSHAPTALLIAKPHHVFIVVRYLLKRGLSVPHDVSLIARDQDDAFIKGKLAISHYKFKNDAFNRQVGRLMQQMIGGSPIPAEVNSIYPEFVACGSIRRLQR